LPAENGRRGRKAAVSAWPPANEERTEDNMIDRRKARRNALVAAAGLCAGLAWAHPGLAQIGTPTGPVACRDFVRNGYGDWKVLRPTKLSSGDVTLDLRAGQTLAPSEFVKGIEPTAVLDGSCGNE
jgi:hypothetical protein